MTSATRSGSTPATSLLTAAGIDFQVHTYEPDASAGSKGIDAARALGVEPARVFKTLVISLGVRLVVAVIPADAHVDLRALAATVGAKRAVLAARDDAERATGYIVGGMSPVGQRKRLPTFVDSSASGHERVFVNGGRRGLMVELAPDDLLELTNGAYAELASGVNDHRTLG